MRWICAFKSYMIQAKVLAGAHEAQVLEAP